MTKVTCDMAVSVDGFTAGPNQSADKPFGDGPVERLTQWTNGLPSTDAAGSKLQAGYADGLAVTALTSGSSTLSYDLSGQQRDAMGRLSVLGNPIAGRGSKEGDREQSSSRPADSLRPAAPAGNW